MKIQKVRRKPSNELISVAVYSVVIIVIDRKLSDIWLFHYYFNLDICFLNNIII